MRLAADVIKTLLTSLAFVVFVVELGNGGESITDDWTPAKTDRFCNYSKTVKVIERHPCSDDNKLRKDGYLIDLQLFSLFGRKDCDFTKYNTVNVPACCDGWRGSDCSQPICKTGCLNKGVCEAPDYCNCDSTSFCGTTCNLDSRKYGNLGFCFDDKSCQEVRATRNNSPLSAEECCYLRAGQYFKLCGKKECMPCSTLPSLYNSSGNTSYNGYDPMTPENYCVGNRGRIKTFDGQEYPYDVCCSYTLFKNVERSVEMDGLGCKMKFIVRPDGNRTVEVARNEVKVDGRQVNSVPGYADKVLKITKVGDFQVIEFPGTTFAWNVRGDWSIRLDGGKHPQGSEATGGLCGNNDNYPGNDFSVRNVKRPLADFLKLWSTKGYQGNCSQPKDSSRCVINDEILKIETIKICLTIKLNAFSACHDKVKVEIFFGRCYEDICNRKNASKAELDEILCRSLEEYAAECSRKGVYFDWRKDGLCYKQCPHKDMEYTELVSPWSPSCRNKRGTDNYPRDALYPGCRCREGLLREGDSCYKPEDCPCVYMGTFYSRGGVLVKDCNNCTCHSGSWSCTKEECPKSCSIFAPNHVTTFDGYFYSFPGSACEFVLVESEGSRTLGLPFLRITAKFDKIGDDSSTHRVAMVTVVLKNGYLTTSVGIKISGRKPLVDLDGKDVSSMAQPIGNDLINLLTSGCQTVVQGSGVLIKIDTEGGVDIKLGLSYNGLVNGLCGNSNGFVEDDLKSRTGILENTRNLVMSYSNCNQSFQRDTFPIDSCSSASSRRQVQEACGILEDQTVMGHQCASAQLSVNFYEACMEALCIGTRYGREISSVKPGVWYYATRKALRCIEESVEFDQRVFEVAVRNTSTLCACPDPLTFQLCRTNINTCRQLSEAHLYKTFIKFEKTCFLGCSCPNGSYLNDKNECVLVSRCSCYDKSSNKSYEPGAEIFKQCTKCQCKSGVWNCSPVVPETSCAAGLTFYPSLLECNTTCDNYNRCWAARFSCSKCACPKGTVLDWQGNCISPDQCGCKYTNKHFVHGEVVTTSYQSCTCVKTKWTCKDITYHKASCSLYGDIHYTGFNGVQRVNSGLSSCAHVLVVANVTSDPECPPLKVTVGRLLCVQLGTMCSRVIDVEIGNNTLTLNKNKHVTFNGQEVTMKSDFYESSELLMMHNQVMFLVFFKTGFSLMHDGGTKLYLYLPNCYKHKVDGLCGRFADEIDDVDDVQRSTWKVNPTCPEPDPHSTGHCDHDGKKLAWVTSVCSAITTAREFAECRKVVDARAFYDECIRSSCSCEIGQDCECTCSALSNFARVCDSRGICVNWRTNHLCPVMCPEGQHYDPCADPVTHVGNHSFPAHVLGSEETSVEGCYCSRDKLLNSNGTCVDKESFGNSTSKPNVTFSTTSKPSTQTQAPSNAPSSTLVTATPPPSGCRPGNSTEALHTPTIPDDRVCKLVSERRRIVASELTDIGCSELNNDIEFDIDVCRGSCEDKLVREGQLSGNGAQSITYFDQNACCQSADVSIRRVLTIDCSNGKSVKIDAREPSSCSCRPAVGCQSG